MTVSRGVAGVIAAVLVLVATASVSMLAREGSSAVLAVDSPRQDVPPGGGGDPIGTGGGRTRHPHLASALRLANQAWEKIEAAQRANEWDMEGHAQRAKELLDQVITQLKLAAEAGRTH